MQTNPTDDELPQLLTIKELAAILKISQRSIWRLVSSGKLIQPLHVGGSIRWRLDAVREWIDRGCPGLNEIPLIASPNDQRISEEGTQ